MAVDYNFKLFVTSQKIIIPNVIGFCTLKKGIVVRATSSLN